jgi:hypothetical protein
MLSQQLVQNCQHRSLFRQLKKCQSTNLSLHVQEHEISYRPKWTGSQKYMILVKITLNRKEENRMIFVINTRTNDTETSKIVIFFPFTRINQLFIQLVPTINLRIALSPSFSNSAMTQHQWVRHFRFSSCWLNNEYDSTCKKILLNGIA